MINRFLNNGFSATADVLSISGWAAGELFPKKVSTVEEVESLLTEVPADGVFNQGPPIGDAGYALVGSETAEFIDAFAKPDFFEDEKVFRLARSIKAGSRAIRSDWLIRAYETSTFGVTSRNVAVQIPTKLFSNETELRYYPQIGDSTPINSMVAFAILESSRGITQTEALKQLELDRGIHEQAIARYSYLFSDEARKKDAEEIDKISQSFDEFYRQTNKSPIDFPIAYVEWFQQNGLGR